MLAVLAQLPQSARKASILKLCRLAFRRKSFRCGKKVRQETMARLGELDAKGRLAGVAIVASGGLGSASGRTSATGPGRDILGHDGRRPGDCPIVRAIKRTAHRRGLVPPDGLGQRRRAWETVFQLCWKISPTSRAPTSYCRCATAAAYGCVASSAQIVPNPSCWTTWA